MLWLLVSIVAGLVSGLKEGTWWDHGTALITLGASAVPNFVLALALQYLFVVVWHVLPFPQVTCFLPNPWTWFEAYLTACPSATSPVRCGTAAIRLRGGSRRSVKWKGTTAPACTQMGDGLYGQSPLSSWMAAYQLRGADTAPDLSGPYETSPSYYNYGFATTDSFHLGGPGDCTSS